MNAEQYGPRPRTHAESIPWFWKSVDKKSVIECWEWKGARLKLGYGRFRSAGKFVQAHRFSYALHAGHIPVGMCVCHRCDNPPCCNPAHLFLGTKKDNADDRDKKGRNKVFRGEAHPSAKATRAIAAAIRAEYEPFKTTGPMLARKHALSLATIKSILQRKSWK